MHRFSLSSGFIRVLLIAAMMLPVPLVPSVSAAQPLIVDADSQYDYARSRLDDGAFDEAILEFNRFIHFFPGDARVVKARYLVGMAHFKAGRYGDAAVVFGDVAGDADQADLRNESFFMLSRSHARHGMIEQAMVDLHNLMALSPRDEVIDRARYELGWLHVDLGQWPLAMQSFGQMDAKAQQRYGIGDLDAALSRHDRIPSKSPFTAGLLSVVPGGGQLYCGRYQDALAALLINAGLILSAWEAFDNELYALGGVISFVEFGFYSGNIYGAVSSAHKFNRDRAGEFRQDLYRRRQSPLFLSATATGAAVCLRIDF